MSVYRIAKKLSVNRSTVVRIIQPYFVDVVALSWLQACY